MTWNFSIKFYYTLLVCCNKNVEIWNKNYDCAEIKREPTDAARAEHRVCVALIRDAARLASKSPEPPPARASGRPRSVAPSHPVPNTSYGAYYYSTTSRQMGHPWSFQTMLVHVLYTRARCGSIMCSSFLFLLTIIVDYYVNLSFICPNRKEKIIIIISCHAFLIFKPGLSIYAWNTNKWFTVHLCKITIYRS